MQGFKIRDGKNRMQVSISGGKIYLITYEHLTCDTIKVTEKIQGSFKQMQK